MQILIVEDNEVLARGLSEALRLLDSGKALHVAANLRAAQEYIAHGNRVDVALVDLGLPDAAGIEAPASLRMLDPDMAIIVVSGSETSHLRLDLLRSGVEDYVPKSEASAARILQAIGGVRHRQKRERRLRNLELVQCTDGVLNKLGFYIAMRSCIDCANRLAIKCGLLAVDLEGLREAVETYGSAAGTIALRQACSRIAHVTRQGDAVGLGDGNLLYVLLKAVSDARAVHAVGEKIRERFSTPLHVNEPIALSVTIGGALYADTTDSVRQWLDAAHLALRDSRATGDGHTVVYETSLMPGPIEPPRDRTE